MKDKQKVYIKGNVERGSEVIKTLEVLGGRNVKSFNGQGIDAYYFISPEGTISICSSHKDEVYPYVKEFYKEIELPRWKPNYTDDYYFTKVSHLQIACP